MSTHFYHTHARDYYNQTIEVDPTSFLSPLINYLQPGSKILDIGCGSGRDMLWLNKRGFHCTGLERSPELAALARQHTGLPVIEADFESFDFSRMIRAVCLKSPYPADCSKIPRARSKRSSRSKFTP